MKAVIVDRYGTPEVLDRAGLEKLDRDISDKAALK